MARHARREDEIALAAESAMLAKMPRPLAAHADAMVGKAVIGGGKTSTATGQVGRAERTAHQPHRERFEFALPLRRHHGDARARLEQALGLAQRHFACATTSTGGLAAIRRSDSASIPNCNTAGGNEGGEIEPSCGAIRARLL